MSIPTDEAATRSRPTKKPTWMKARVSMHRRPEQDRISREILDRAPGDFDDH